MILDYPTAGIPSAVSAVLKSSVAPWGVGRIFPSSIEEDWSPTNSNLSFLQSLCPRPKIQLFLSLRASWVAADAQSEEGKL